MHRTQIYLTDQQWKLVGQRATGEGVSQSEVIRRVLDEALGLLDGTERRVAVIDSTAGTSPDSLPWQEWLAEVRGRSAADRLTGLGL